MWVRGTVVGTATGASGKMFRSRPTHDVTPQHVEMPLPTGLATLDALPSYALYRDRLYSVGMWTDNIVTDEHFRTMRQGIRPPTEVPVLTASGGPGRTGSCVVCIAFWDEMTDEWSPLSAPSLPLALSNNLCTTSNIPATAESRVTHVGIWVSMNGASFRLSTKRQIGVTTITEGVATLALGMAFFPTFERFPRGTVNTIYHERQIIAGDSLHPDVLYVSALFHPERYEGLSFRTRNGEPIVALVPTRDICLVMTPSGAYGLRGWTEDDMELQPIDADIGAINHQGWRVIHGNAWGPSPKTLWMYNGAFHDMLKDRQTEWQEFYQENVAAFENAISIHDPNDGTYSFIVRGGAINSYAKSTIPDPASTGTPQTVMWTADYRGVQPELGGNLAQPDWNVDVMFRRVDSAAYLSLPGSKRGDVYYGFCDGISRKKDADDADDDGDAYGKRFWLRTAAIGMGDPGGDVTEGKDLRRLWSYVESETCAWTLYCKGGDEDAWRMLTPDNSLAFWKDATAASAFSELRGADTFTFAAKSVHPHKPDKVTGRAFTFEYTVLAPLRFSLRGFGGIWGPGPATRPVLDILGGE